MMQPNSRRTAPDATPHGSPRRHHTYSTPDVTAVQLTAHAAIHAAPRRHTAHPDVTAPHPTSHGLTRKSQPRAHPTSHARPHLTPYGHK
eukprot:7255818-Prymnesium_polylepis.1